MNFLVLAHTYTNGSIPDNPEADLKDAMKNKDTKKRDALRLLSSAFKQIEVDERKELSDDDIIKIIQKQVKQRNDSISQYKEANRDDLVQKEQSQIDIFSIYLPKQLTDEELEVIIAEIINSQFVPSHIPQIKMTENALN